jgi:putative nucleotidyltransferase with HDIG domain
VNRRLGALIAITASVSLLLLAYVVVSFPILPELSVGVSSFGMPIGLLFWVALTTAGSSLAVRMPGGSVVDVNFAPIVAAMNLGGPAAAAWAGLIGATQARELRGRVPWYGVVANHSSIMAPAIVGSLLLNAVPYRSGNMAVDFSATVGAAFVLFTGNVLLTSVFVSLREGQSVWRQIGAIKGALLNLIALAPVAWLMAQMYRSAGWWAVLLFAVPLYTTRLAYSRYFEVLDLVGEKQHLVDELRKLFTETVSSLAYAVEKRDTFTIGHSRNVQEIAKAIGVVMKVSDDELEALEWGGLLHDIGKIGVPDSVLLKQGALTREERTIMNSHPVKGAEIISPVARLAPELPIIRHHHEWFNGSGYPDGLAGDDIPRLARILHVADAFEAMTASRPYRMTPLTPEQAVAELRKFGGIQFDPEVVDAFVRTEYAHGVADAGRDEVRAVPLIGQAAGTLAVAGRTPGAA